MRLAVLLLTTFAITLQPQEVSRSTPPRVIHKVDPMYTQEALDAKLEGTVVLGCTVGTDGVPTDISVRRRLAKGLDEKAVECSQAWRFKPGTHDGEPIPVHATVEINFRLPPTK